METEVLEDLGLTAREITVYITLLEMGESSAGPIKQKTELQNSVIHACLSSLLQKGLVSYVEKGKRRHYTATNPKHLIDFIEEKKRRVEQIIPALIAKQAQPAKYAVHIYEGAKGLRSIHEDILAELSKGEEFLVLGAPKEAHDRFEAYFLDFHVRRQKKGIKLRAIYKKEAKEYAEKRKNMKETKIKYMPDRFTAPMWTTVFKNKTVLFVVGEMLLGIVIENKTVAKNFREYFEVLWKVL